MRRVRWLLAHAEEVGGGAVVLALALLAFVNIVARYLVNYALAFTEELEVAGLVWLTMFGAAIGFRRSIHIGFTILRDRLPGRGRRLAVVLSLVVTVTAAVGLVWAGWAQVRAERALGAVSEALGIPQWLYTAAVPVGAVLIIARVVQAARGEIDRT